MSNSIKFPFCFFSVIFFSLEEEEEEHVVILVRQWLLKIE